MSSRRAGMQPNFLPRGAGWWFPAGCAGAFLVMQIASWIAGGMASGAQADAAALEQQVSGLAKPQGKSWRELEQAKMDDREKQAQELRTRFSRPEPENLSWLALRQKQEDLEKLLRARAAESKTVLPEKLEFSHGPEKDGQAAGSAGDAWQASELAAEGLLLWMQQEGTVIGKLSAGVSSGRASAHLEGTMSGRSLCSFLTMLQRSGLTPQKVELKRGDGISPPITLAVDLVCPDLRVAPVRAQAKP